MNTARQHPARVGVAGGFGIGVGASFGRLAVLVGLAVGVSLGLVGCDAGPVEIDRSGPVAGWPHVGGDLGGGRYSPLTQITRENVGSLVEAWRYESGDVTPTTSLQVTPIVVHSGELLVDRPLTKVIAPTFPGTQASSRLE